MGKILFLSLFLLVSCARGTLVKKGIVKINPLFDQLYMCSDHGVERMGIGDVFGKDCVIVDFVDNKNGKWVMPYKGSGYSNKDWFGYKADVLAPFDGEVIEVSENHKVNKPGSFVRSRAGAIIFKRVDGVMLLYAHTREPLVKKGDKVKRGQIVARVGNNGSSYSPHIHIGAWLGKKPLQIVFDLNEWEKTIQKLYPEMYKK